MTATKRKNTSALLLAASLAGIGLLGPWAFAGDRSASDDGLTARVDQKVGAWQPTKGERRLDEIGWAKDIRDALALARANHRPVFLFTYSGSTNREHAMALQRC
jgi:hypothetical protein